MMELATLRDVARSPFRDGMVTLASVGRMTGAEEIGTAWKGGVRPVSVDGSGCSVRPVVCATSHSSQFFYGTCPSAGSPSVIVMAARCDSM
jgi:hypothetical protein